MEYRNRSAGFLAILVFAFGLMLQGAAIAQEKATATQPMAKTGKVTLKGFLKGGPDCSKFEPVPRNKKQTVSIAIDTQTTPPTIEFKSKKCVEESASAEGSLTFTVADLPDSYQLEIEFETRRDGNQVPHKGPFKFKAKKPNSKYPVAGRCMMSKTPNDSCVFDEHDLSIQTGEVFRFSVFLWDADGNLADEKDPGVMVVDNP